MINKSMFCTLSSRSAWHTWLSDASKELYQQFSEEMRRNRGCADNKKTMIKIYEELQKDATLYQTFIEFIKSTFPFVISEPVSPKDEMLNKLFNNGLLTFPRRKVLNQGSSEFVSDKLKSLVYFDGSKYYIEYLEKDDQHLIDKIPAEKWYLSKYTVKEK
jgi:hypothetical protein